MAIYHFTAKIITRSSGQNAVASAAYRAGQKLVDEKTGEIKNFENKKGCDFEKILLPKKAPDNFSDRQVLWNAVEAKETRKNSQLAREIELALPIELSEENKKQLVLDFVNDKFVKLGMIADVNIHHINGDNPHAHIMLTTRRVDKTGFTEKAREWNDKNLLEQWREDWANYANLDLKKSGINEIIDHRTLKDQGIDRIPQIHVGLSAKAINEKNQNAIRHNLNEKIKKLNDKLAKEDKKINQKIIDFEEIKKSITTHEKNIIEAENNYINFAKSHPDFMNWEERDYRHQGLLEQKRKIEKNLIARIFEKKEYTKAVEYFTQREKYLGMIKNDPYEQKKSKERLDLIDKLKTLREAFKSFLEGVLDRLDCITPEKRKEINQNLAKIELDRVRREQEKKEQEKREEMEKWLKNREEEINRWTKHAPESVKTPVVEFKTDNPGNDIDEAKKRLKELLNDLQVENEKTVRNVKIERDDDGLSL